MPQKSARAEMIAALGEMDDNLRHLGLRHDTAADPARGQRAGDGGAAYLESIRGAKEGRRRLRVEREYRQFLASQHDQHGASEQGGADEATAAAAAIVDGAGALLAAESRGAAAAVGEREARHAAAGLRADQQGLRQAQKRAVLAGAAAAVPTTATATATIVTTTSSSRALATAAAPETARDFCGAIATGLIDLAVRVSDNRFLPIAGLGGDDGPPVRRVAQDLAVTAWRGWADTYVWSRALPTADGDAPARRGKRRSGPSCVFSDDEAGEAGALADPAAAETAAAAGQVAFAAEQQLRHETALGAAAVDACLAQLRREGDKLCHAALEDIRRDTDAEAAAVAAADAAAGADGNSADVDADPIEVFPGWAQRLPPAGCFVFGDDLSGAVLLCETVEKAYLVANGSGGQHGRGSQFSEDFSAALTKSATGSSGAAASGHDSRRASAASAAHPPGVLRREGGLQRLYVTPRTLLNAFPSPYPAAGATTASGRRHSASRARGTAKAASTAGVAAGSGGNSNTGETGSGGPPAPAVSEEEEQREFEALTEALQRELLAAHVHNLHLGTAGRVPDAATVAAGFGPPAAADDKASQKCGRAASASRGPSSRTGTTSPKQQQQQQAGAKRNKAARPREALAAAADASLAGAKAEAEARQLPVLPLTLMLIGFPQAEGFYQLLQAKLTAAVDGAEYVILLHQEQRRLTREAADLAVQLLLSKGQQQQQLQQQQLLQQHSRGASSLSPAPTPPPPQQPPQQPAPATKAKGGSGGRGGNSSAEAAPPTLQQQVTEAALVRRARARFPPLCVVGCFLEYSQLERSRRLQRAYTRARHGTDAAARRPATVHHDVYGPEVLVVGGTGPREESAGCCSPRAASILGAAMSVKRAAVAFTDAVAAGAARRHGGGVASPGKGIQRVSDWAVPRIRETLTDHQARWERWWEQWRGAFPYTPALQRLLLADPSQSQQQQQQQQGTAGGEAAARPSSSRDSKSKRRRPPSRSGSGKSHGGAAAAVDAAATSSDAAAASQQSASAVPSGGSPRARAANSQETAVPFPKALFFARTYAVALDGESDGGAPAEEATPPVAGSGEGTATPTTEGDAATAATVSPLYSFRGGNRAIDAERARVVRGLCTGIAAATVPAVGQRIFTAESLAPGQLPAPLRLSDYHRSPQACAALVNAHRAYAARLNGAPGDAADHLDANDGKAAGAARDCAPCVAAEVEVMRAFTTYLFEAFGVVALDVFPPSLWACTAAAAEATEVTNVAHFNAIDDSYRSARARVAALHAEFVGHLQGRCGVWWLHAVEAALAAVAAAMDRLVAEVSAAGGGCPVGGAGTVGAEFLAAVGRPSADELEAMAALLLQPMGRDGVRAGLFAVHDSYAADVKAAVIAALSAALTAAFATAPSESPVGLADWPAVAPALAECILGQLFIPCGGGGGGGSVSPYLARCAVVVGELAACLHETDRRACAWLRELYRVALQLPPGESLQRTGARPTGLPGFFGPLPPTVPEEGTMSKAPSAAAAATRATGSPISPWIQMNLTLYLASLSLHRAPALNELAFLHAHTMTQLQCFWSHLPDRSGPLAAAVGAHAPGAVAPPSDAAAAAAAGAGNPPSGVWMMAYFTLCVCRPAAVTAAATGGTVAPFLSLEELRCLFRRYAATDHGSVTLIELRQLLLLLLLRHCCFCEGTPHSCPWRRLWAVQMPAARGIRRAMSSLPASIRAQLATEAEGATGDEGNDEDERTGNPHTPDSSELAREWAAVLWWPMMTAATVALSPPWGVDALSLPWVLLEMVTARFALGPQGCLRAPSPSLPQVLMRVALVGFSREATLERMFHSAVALKLHGTPEEDRAAAVDTVALTVEEFVFYFSALAGHGPPRARPPISLADDTRLLLLRAQSRSADPQRPVEGVTLPLLLASHWGRALVNTHFAYY